jgi:hypothetical protein
MLPGAQAKPLFPNSVVSNDIDFIRADDPTVEFEVSNKGRVTLELPGSLVERPLVVGNAYLLELNYKDGAKVEIHADPLFAYTLIKHPGRMPKHIEEAIPRIMPNRLEYLRGVFADLENAMRIRQEDK